MTRLGSPAMTQQDHRTWVQTERAAHEAWARLVLNNGKAAALMHLLVAQMADKNAVVVPRATLAKMMNTSEATVKRAIAVLKAERWIETIQIGGKGGVNAYVVNSRVAWAEKRENLHLALFEATVIADATEQAEGIGGPQLRQIPVLFPSEQQLPSGPGEDPPAQPSFEGMEADLPALQEPPRGAPILLNGSKPVKTRR